MKDKKKKYVIAGIIVAIVVIVAILLSSSYAYWQLTRKQTSPNDVVALCLDLTIDSETGSFGLLDAWPISDEDGMALEGFTFTVKNNCEKSINYIVGLNSVETEANTNYIDYGSIKVMLDDNNPLIYADLGDIEYENAEDTAVIRDSKQLSIETIAGGDTNSHTVKAWIDSESPVSEQGKTFSGKVFITGGQGIIYGDDCFTIAEDGTIWGYNEACGLNVTVPAEVNGIAVKTINRASFNEGILVVHKMYGEETDSNDWGYEYQDAFIILNGESQRDEITDTFINELDSTEEVVILNNLDEYYEYDFSNYKDEYVNVYWNLSTGVLDAYSNIITLDLSEAIYLETIGENALFGYRPEEYGFCEGLEIISLDSKTSYCKSPLKKVVLPENGALTEIGQDAFSDNNLTEINIPNTIKSLSGFAGNYITEIEIPRSVEEIGNSAFSNNQIKELFIPSNVKTIGASAFSGGYYNRTRYLEKITFEDTEENPSELTTINYNAFGYNMISEITIPNTVEKIGSYAFRINELNKVNIIDTEENPSQLKSIGERTFETNNLTRFVIPKSVTEIGSYVFYDNASLAEVIIKRSEEDALANMTLGDFWTIVGQDSNSQTLYATITYNPNYTE